MVRTQSQCSGDRRRYVYDGDRPLLPPLAKVHEDAGAHREREAEDDGAAQKDGPPDTVVELTRETARRTSESLERAADETAETTRSVGERMRDAVSDTAGAVDRAARNTLKCIGSLFDDC